MVEGEAAEYQHLHLVYQHVVIIHSMLCMITITTNIPALYLQAVPEREFHLHSVPNKKSGSHERKVKARAAMTLKSTA